MSDLSWLRQTLTDRFDEGELRTLAFELNIDYDSLPHSGKSNKARDLVAYCQRRKRIPELVAAGRSLRRDIDWGAMGDIHDGVAPGAKEQQTEPGPEQPATGVSVAGRDSTIHSGGDTVGRDKVTTINIGGDMVGRDKFTFVDSTVTIGDRDQPPSQRSDRQALVDRLNRLRASLEAAQGGAIDDEAAILAGAQLQAAALQAEKPDADPEVIMKRLRQARAMIEASAGQDGPAADLTAAITRAMEVVHKVFG